MRTGALPESSFCFRSSLEILGTATAGILLGQSRGCQIGGQKSGAGPGPGADHEPLATSH